ncbi:MAG: tetratricopeptide repeat protein, partial [Phycisphaerae bacterium]
MSHRPAALRSDRRAPILLICLLAWFTPAGVVDAQPNADGDLREYYSANGLANRGLYELAATEYRAFLASHERHEKAATARYGLAVCLFRSKQYAAAAEELETLASQPKFVYAAETATMLGQCRLIQGQFNPAAKVFGRVVEKFADHDLADDAMLGRGEALYRGGSHEQAARVLEQMLERWSDSPLRDRADYFCALAQIARNEFEPAAAH